MTKPQIIKRVRLWQAIMGLTNWDIEIAFKKMTFKEANGEWGEGIAKVDTNNQYKLATITFEKTRLWDVQDSSIVHEMIHCVLSQLVGMARANMRDTKKKEHWLDYFHEQTVSELERIMMRLAIPKKGEQVKL